jgi:hypothetical protein
VRHQTKKEKHKMSELKTEEECKAANGIWADGKCQMPAAKTKTATTELPINEKLIAVMKEYMDQVLTEFKADITKRMAEEKVNIENELVSSVRTGLGIQKDPVIHLSEVEGVVRKIVLNTSGEAKKTLTETTDKPSEGDLTKNAKIDIKTQFEQILAGKGAL